MVILIVLISSILSAIFYRLGGLGRDFSKGFIFKSIIRDAGVSIVFGISYALISEIDTKTVLCILLSAALLWASLSTYHKWINKVLGRKREKLDFLTYSFTGLCYGLSAFPLIFSEINALLLGIRAVLLAVLVGGAGCIKNSWVSEPIRGAVIPLTIPILMIGS